MVPLQPYIFIINAFSITQGLYTILQTKNKLEKKEKKKEIQKKDDHKKLYNRAEALRNYLNPMRKGCINLDGLKSSLDEKMKENPEMIEQEEIEIIEEQSTFFHHTDRKESCELMYALLDTDSKQVNDLPSNQYFLY